MKWLSVEKKLKNLQLIIIVDGIEKKAEAETN